MEGRLCMSNIEVSAARSEIVTLADCYLRWTAFHTSQTAPVGTTMALFKRSTGSGAISAA